MISIRPARTPDIGSITRIHNAAVVGSIATFDERPSTVDERTAWFEQFSATGPHRLFVATDDDAGDAVLGYARSVRYRQHPAFDETVEFTVYLDAPARGLGVGTMLYERLIATLQREHVHCAVAGIALPNDASVALHRGAGFEDVGVFREYASKHGERIDSLWMQRLLGG